MADRRGLSYHVLRAEIKGRRGLVLVQPTSSGPAQGVSRISDSGTTGPR